MLEQWVTKTLLKYKITNKIELDAELVAARAALQLRIGARLGISMGGSDDEDEEEVSEARITAILREFWGFSLVYNLEKVGNLNPNNFKFVKHVNNTSGQFN